MFRLCWLSLSAPVDTDQAIVAPFPSQQEKFANIQRILKGKFPFGSIQNCQALSSYRLWIQKDSSIFHASRFRIGSLISTSSAETFSIFNRLNFFKKKLLAKAKIAYQEFYGTGGNRREQVSEHNLSKKQTCQELFTWFQSPKGTSVRETSPNLFILIYFNVIFVGAICPKLSS